MRPAATGIAQRAATHLLDRKKKKERKMWSSESKAFMIVVPVAEPPQMPSNLITLAPSITDKLAL